MLVSYSWVQDYIREELPNAATIADALTMHSFEVEDMYSVGLRYPGIIVSRITSIQSHPNADRLSLTSVDIGGVEEHPIVCGAGNIEEGMRVPVALPGTTLPDGTAINVTRIRDVDSYGMILSKAELGLEQTSDGIYPLAEGEPGQLFDVVMGTGVDTIFDVDILANRASDCLSHRGMAREIAAVLGLTFIDVGAVLSEFGGNTLSVTIDDTERCRRYTGAHVSGISVGESPQWLKDRLTAVGQRPINNVVDATNYVMLGIGQPVHAFDADLVGDHIHNSISVRAPEGGEQITTLDEQTHDIPADAVVIADGEQGHPIALGGVMGGSDTAVSGETKALILEAASFSPVHVRKTAQATKTATESSKRFENEVTPALTERAIALLIEILRECNQNNELTVHSLTDTYPSPHEVPDITVTADRVAELLGTPIAADRIPTLLQPLGCSVEMHANTVTVRPPPERLDITIAEDVIEEVGRLHGFNAVTEKALPNTETPPSVSSSFATEHHIRDVLVKQGFTEVMTYALREHGEIEIADPLASDKAFYRSTLCDGLASSLNDNEKHLDLLGVTGVHIFEIGNVYKDGTERTMLGVASKPGKNETRTGEEVITNVVEVLEKELAVSFPAVTEAYHHNVYEIDLTPFYNKVETVSSPAALTQLHNDVTFTPVSPYPYVLRDVAVWVPSGTSAEDVETVIANSANKWLANRYLFDTYEKDTATSYAFRLVFQSNERTLSDEEVNKVMDGIYEALQDRKGWEIR